MFYTKDQPAKSKGKLKITIAKVPDGVYSVEVYKVGYRCNDVYTSYLSMGMPAQLNKQQVEQLKKQNDGSPVAREIVTVKNGVPFSKELDLRENDVFFLNLIKL